MSKSSDAPVYDRKVEVLQYGVFFDDERQICGFLEVSVLNGVSESAGVEHGISFHPASSEDEWDLHQIVDHDTGEDEVEPAPAALDVRQMDEVLCGSRRML